MPLPYDTYTPSPCMACGDGPAAPNRELWEHSCPAVLPVYRSLAIATDAELGHLKDLVGFDEVKRKLVLELGKTWHTTLAKTTVHLIQEAMMEAGPGHV